MKAIDILKESRIDEAPAGMLKQIGRGLASKALGAVGLNTWSQEVGGKKDEGDRANQYNELFRRYLGQTGKTTQTATYADVANFLKINGLNPAYVKGIQGPIIQKELDEIFLKMANDYFQGKSGPDSAGGRGARGATTQPGGQQAVQPGGQQTVQPGGQQVAPNNATGQTATQPFSIPALIQVIPQMSKRDLKKLNSAVQAALQNPAQAAKTAATTTAPNATAGMTPAQIRAIRQAAAANVVQAQQKANPAPVKPAPVNYDVPAYQRRGQPAPAPVSPKKPIAV